MSKYSTARGSSKGFSRVSPTKFEACKSLLEIKMRRSLVKLPELVKFVTKMVTGCFRKIHKTCRAT